jgi:hypothetical protein
MEFSTIRNAMKQTGLSYLGGVNISAKMIKNEKVSGNFTYSMYLASANESGYNVCPNSTPECRLGCLNTSGRASMDLLCGLNIIKNSRINKTKMFHEHNEFFMKWLFADIKAKQPKAIKKGLAFSVRLNGTSDIDWQNAKLNGKNVFEQFPDVQFYDYTKNPAKFALKPENYQLTFSYSGRNTETCKKLLSKGFNVAVVFNVQKETELPKTFLGYQVVNGDLTDFRPNDGSGVIIGLKWKKIANKANNDAIKTSVFVIQKENIDCVY